MTKVLGVHHVAVSVPDLDRAREFYVDLLGLEEISSTDWPAGTESIDKVVGLKNCAGRQMMLRAKNTYLEVFEYTAPKAKPQEPNRPVNEYGYTHFGIQVDDARAVFDRLTKAGISFHTDEPVHYPSESGGENTGFRATYGRDFFGNVFEIIEINEGSAVAPL